ncbi:MAG: ComF family protein [Bacillota bacterium]|nr:ComF family protein [Bacillota bacterium]
MKGIFPSLAEGFFDLIYPSNIYCICCGNIIDDSRPYSLCDVCVRSMKWANGRTCSCCGKRLQDDYLPDLCTNCRDGGHLFTKGFACAEYGAAERDILHRFKYKDKAYLGRKLAELMRDRILSETLELDLILPVPMHKRKEKVRGYNQAAVLAKELARLLEKPYCRNLLLRSSDTEAMNRLGAEERSRNVQEAFVVSSRKNDLLRGKKVLLVDDIFTTGSTADACTDALLRADASEVFVFVFAAGANLISETDDGVRG